MSSFECEQCVREFRSEEALDQHTRAVHPTYECEQCDREFRSEEALDQHTRVVYPMYECEQCDREFRSEDDLVSTLQCGRSYYVADCKVFDNIESRANACR